MNIYVGNLSRNTSEDNLKKAFEEFGKVDTANVIKDKFSGQPKGFGFVEMPEKEQAQAAINGLNGKQLDGMTLNVNEAYPKKQGGGHRSGGFRRGNGQRGGGGGFRKY